MDKVDNVLHPSDGLPCVFTRKIHIEAIGAHCCDFLLLPADTFTPGNFNTKSFELRAVRPTV